MATIGELCNREVVVAAPGTTVTAAAKLMRRHHVGSIVVVDEAEAGMRIPVGIVTDRDIVMEVCAPELDPDLITVGDIMSRELVTAAEDEGVLETMEIMRYKGVRRIPVVGPDRQLTGIISVDDLLDVLAEELGELTKVLAREQAREAATRR
ncbi:MAG: CBS domain-containing protein [Rhodospirillaceae bacterium]